MINSLFNPDSYPTSYIRSWLILSFIFSLYMKSFPETPVIASSAPRASIIATCVVDMQMIFFSGTSIIDNLSELSDSPLILFTR